MNAPQNTQRAESPPRSSAQRRAAAVVAQYLNDLSGRRRPKPQLPAEARA